MNNRLRSFTIVSALLCCFSSASSMAQDDSAVLAGDHGRSLPASEAKAQAVLSTPLPQPSVFIVFNGKQYYWISNTAKAATLTSTQIVNYSGNFASGPLSLRLFATTSPITGPFTYLTVGESSLDPLRPEYAYNYFNSVADLNTIPDGTYYMHLGIFESSSACTGTSDGYCVDDWVTFPAQIQVVNGIYVVSGLQTAKASD